MLLYKPSPAEAIHDRAVPVNTEMDIVSAIVKPLFLTFHRSVNCSVPPKSVPQIGSESVPMATHPGCRDCIPVESEVQSAERLY